MEDWRMKDLIEIKNDWKKAAQEQAEKINTALYELKILHEKVDPSKNSSIDSHFKRIIDILQN